MSLQLGSKDFSYLRKNIEEIKKNSGDLAVVRDTVNKMLNRIPKGTYTKLRSLIKEVGKVTAEDVRICVNEVDYLLDEVEEYQPEFKYEYVIYKVIFHENGQDEEELLVEKNSPVIASQKAEDFEKKLTSGECIQIRFEKRLQKNPHLQ